MPELVSAFPLFFLSARKRYHKKKQKENILEQRNSSGIGTKEIAANKVEKWRMFTLLNDFDNIPREVGMNIIF